MIAKQRFLERNNISIYNRAYKEDTENNEAGSETNQTEEVAETEEKKTEEKFDEKGFFNKGKDKKTEEVEIKETESSNENTTISKDNESISDNSALSLKEINEILVSELSEEDSPFELPEELKTGKNKEGKVLTAKEKFDILKDIIIDNTDFTGGNEYVENLIKNKEQDTFLNDYLDYRSKGKSHVDYIKQKAQELDLTKMSNKEKAIQYLKEYREENYKPDKEGKWEDGWNDEEIEESVDEKSKIDVDIMAKNYDSTLNARRIANQKREIEKANKEFDSWFEKEEKENTSYVNNFIKRLDGKNTIAGLEYGEADIAQFKKELPEFVKNDVKINPKTGLKYYNSKLKEAVDEIMAKPEDSLELISWLWLYKNNKVKGYTNRVKETVKKNVDDSLDNTVKTNTGNPGIGSLDPEGYFGKKKTR